jgi:hypothetical protein
MDKKIAGLLGAAAALSTMHTAQAATEPENRSAPAANYRDLLEPVPNALDALKADDAQTAAEQQPLQMAQFYYHHHHHHHHHRYYPVVPGPYFRYHHHHHHHHRYHHHHGFRVYIR